MSIEHTIPNYLTGLLIGKNGDSLKQLMAKTKAQIIIPKVLDYVSPERLIQIKGTKEQIEEVKKEINALATSSSTNGKAAAYIRAQQQQMMQAMMTQSGIFIYNYLHSWARNGARKRFKKNG